MGQWATYLRRKRTEHISIERLADELRAARYVVALTGAGVSAESGIPTFRDPSDGLWTRYDPAVYATIWGFWRNPSKIWLLLHEFLNENEPVPNRAHLALARLEALGIVRAVVTQNVDNLHQDAGSIRVIEYHGNLMNASCYRCGAKMQLTKQMARNPSFKKKLPPKCGCGGYFKPDAVLFGEGIPSQAVSEANKEADACDLMLVVGTSATVHPASDIPYRAMRKGAKVIEVNLEETGLTNRISDMIYIGRASDLMQTLQLLEPHPSESASGEDSAAEVLTEPNVQAGAQEPPARGSSDGPISS